MVIDQRKHRLHVVAECRSRPSLRRASAAGQEEFKKINADLSKKWPVIARRKPRRRWTRGRRRERRSPGNLS